MKYKANKKTPVNIAYLKKNLILICLSYFFAGFNVIISAVCGNSPDDKFFKITILLGVVLLCRVPLAYFDTRREMQGKSYVVACMVIHLIFSLFAAYIFSFWWTMLFYAIEVPVSMGIFVAKKRTRKRKTRQPSFKRQK